MEGREAIKRRLGACAAWAFAALALAACGDDPDTPRERVAAALADARERFSTGDLAGVCDGCEPRLMRLLAQSGATLADSGREVLAVDGSGARAKATVRLGRWLPGTIRLREDGDVWRLSALEARPIPERTKWEPLTGGTDEYSETRKRLGRQRLCPPVDRVGLTPSGLVLDACSMNLRTGAATVTVLTAFGDVEIARCKASYQLYVDSANILGHRVRFRGGPICRRVSSCRGDMWAGYWIPPPGPGFALRYEVCVDTPVGKMSGAQVVRFVRRGSGWEARVADHPVGESAVLVGGTWRVADVEAPVRVP